MKTPRKKPARKKVEPSNVWIDPETPGKEYTHAEMMKRLRDVYGIDPKACKGMRTMLSHVDGDTWFSWSYRWLIGGKEFVQQTVQARTGMDREIWAGEW